MVDDGSVDGAVQAMVIRLWVAAGVVERVMPGHGQPPDLLKEQLQPPVHLDGQLLLPGNTALHSPHSATVGASSPRRSADRPALPASRQRLQSLFPFVHTGNVSTLCMVFLRP